ncbi:unnamed protein product [Pleuronectes platessa]|uniref:Uncharacterized protein n=1 Tax=Pleuronectes platessa TaxID=8262 RepID=A0A9N7VTR6_PLEPL|nr:unnamed protein product [Pleuronectes platessa]
MAASVKRTCSRSPLADAQRLLSTSHTSEEGNKYAEGFMGYSIAGRTGGRDCINVQPESHRTEEEQTHRPMRVLSAHLLEGTLQSRRRETLTTCHVFKDTKQLNGGGVCGRTVPVWRPLPHVS